MQYIETPNCSLNYAHLHFQIRQLTHPFLLVVIKWFIIHKTSPQIPRILLKTLLHMTFYFLLVYKVSICYVQLTSI